jgi:hypothetical protein
MENTEKPIAKTCPRCDRIIDPSALNCSDFPYCLNLKIDKEETESTDQDNSGIDFSGFLAIAIFFFAFVASIFQLARTASEYGIFEAIRRHPGLPAITGLIAFIILILYIIDSKEKLEERGLEIIYRITRNMLVFIFIMIAFIVISEIIFYPSPLSLMDNFRR